MAIIIACATLVGLILPLWFYLRLLKNQRQEAAEKKKRQELDSIMSYYHALSNLTVVERKKVVQVLLKVADDLYITYKGEDE